MKRSTLKELPSTKEMIDVFGGYNHNLRIREGEFYDMENLSSTDYPVLSPRHKRGKYTFPSSITNANVSGIVEKNGDFYYVDNGKPYKNKSFIAGFAMNDSPKTILSMGPYIIIFPDGFYFNTIESEDRGWIETYFMCNKTAIFSPCKLDGSEYDAPVQDTAPTNPQNLDYWIDTSSTSHELKQYSSTTKQWTSVATTYIKIKAFDGHSDNVAGRFEVGDCVCIYGIKEKEVADMLKGIMVIQAKGNDYIVVKGMLDKSYTQDCSIQQDFGEDAGNYLNAVEFERPIPEMDFVIESGNRLWGCRYGVKSKDTTTETIVNEIYASKLGDFKNWYCFEGISTDSYVASVGTDGQFTGAITYLGYPLFFKENFVHKVYGNYPANYQIQTTALRGVQKGCSKSLAILNETLYYKSRLAVCAYDGSLPVEISQAFGDVSYSDAVAGVLGNKYYISMKDSEDYHLFVYDASKGMWHREDNTQVVEFCNCQGNLYYIDYADNNIYMVREESGEDKELGPIKWKAITGIIGTDSPDKKYISSLVVRIMLEFGATVRFYAEYDSNGEYEHLFTMSGKKLQSFSIPIRLKRCDHLRLKIEGQGMAKIYSICMTIEQGSEI